MKNILVSGFLIWTLVFVSISQTNLIGQTVTKESIAQKEAQPTTNSPLELTKSKFFQKRNALADVLDTPVNFDKIEKESAKNLPKRKMSGKSKAMWVAIVVGLAVGLFFLIKYAKECEIEDPNCPPDETICPCLKYKEKTP